MIKPMTKYPNRNSVKKSFSQFPIASYFYKLSMTPKPDLKKATDMDLIKWGMKYYIGLGFFVAGNKYHAFLGYLTNYFPFSLLFQEKLYHARNKEIRALVEKLEMTASKVKMPILIHNGSPEGSIYEFIANPQCRMKDDDLSRLEKKFQSEYGNVYVRKDTNRVRIIVPIQLL